VALSSAEAKSLADTMIGQLSTEFERHGRGGRVARYLAGDHDLPYTPKSANTEFRTLSRRSVTNWLPLISDTFAKGLFVDGYRPAKASENASAWRYWQENGLDARQTIAHRGALEYGVSYVRVLPGDSGPSIRPLNPTRSLALYEDDEDEFPYVGILRAGTARDGGALWRLYDDEAEYTFRMKDGSLEQIGEPDIHGLGVTPFVRFRDRLDGQAHGIIEPLIPIQDRVNESVFSLLIALQYASFRQRWATGLAIPTDTNEFLSDGVTANPNYGKPLEPFEAAVNRLWVSDSPDAKFGDFAQTEVSGHLNTYKSTVQSLAAIAQTPPHVLLGDLVNLSADALAAAEASTQRKGAEYETLFGESWEQTLRLAALADGDLEGAADTSAQVRWRDTEARSLAQTVDALGKMVQMLAVPAEAAWERIPGVTDQDVERWREMRNSGDSLSALAEALTRQTEGPMTQTV
jgi:hypothetical protein